MRCLSRYLFLTTIFVLLCLSSGHAKELWQTLPKPSSAVSDYANLISRSDEAKLEGLCRALYKETGSALVIVTLSSMEGGQIDDFANRLYEHWGIGDKATNKGVLFLVSVKDRKTRIEVGYGLEPVLTDLISKSIIDHEVIPAFKSKNFSKGITNGSKAIIGVIAKNEGVNIEGAPAYSAQASRSSDDSDGDALIIVIFIIIILLSRFFRTSRGYHSGPSIWISGGGFGGGSGGGGSFGGFGGGFSGGGGASGSW